jgi:hypothetical protein
MSTGFAPLLRGERAFFASGGFSLHPEKQTPVRLRLTPPLTGGAAGFDPSFEQVIP